MFLQRGRDGDRTRMYSKPAVAVFCKSLDEVVVERLRIATEICPHTFRATGITNYLINSGSLEIAQQMAAHADARTTKLYDRRNEQVSLDEIERITI